jgi:hypothetical protein
MIRRPSGVHGGMYIADTDYIVNRLSLITQHPDRSGGRTPTSASPRAKIGTSEGVEGELGPESRAHP